jgi:hypothetical protein
MNSWPKKRKTITQWSISKKIILDSRSKSNRVLLLRNLLMIERSLS